MTATFVFVHGSLQGSYSWKRVTRLLAKHNRNFVCVDLPSCGYDVDKLGDVQDDIDCIKNALDSTHGQKILVAHSYGGFPVTQCSAGRKDIDKLIYICAFMPSEGQSIHDLSDGLPVLFKIVHDGRAIQHIDESTHGEQIKYQSTQSFQMPIEKCGWRHIPSLYILCSEDEDLPPANQQKMAQHATKIMPIQSGHYPFFTNTQELVDMLLSL